MVKLLELEQEFKTFMVRAIFGTKGDPYRHGDADSGERTVVLFSVAALAGWLEQFAGAAYLTELDERMTEAIPAAAERVQLPVLVRVD